MVQLLTVTALGTYNFNACKQIDDSAQKFLLVIDRLQNYNQSIYSTGEVLQRSIVTRLVNVTIIVFCRHQRCRNVHEKQKHSRGYVITVINFFLWLQEEPQKATEPLQNDETKNSNNVQEAANSQQDKDDKEESSDSSNNSSESDDEEERPIHIKLPLQLDFDDLAGALMEKNQRSRMNCIVEKKRAEEIVDHQPKTVNLPFGVNLTTDPRYERLSGERMAIFCESGNMQRLVLLMCINISEWFYYSF